MHDLNPKATVPVCFSVKSRDSCRAVARVDCLDVDYVPIELDFPL